MSQFTRGVNRIASVPPIQVPIDSRQVRNDAGGYVYQMEEKSRIFQFLVMGTTNSYYSSKEEMIAKNLKDIRVLVNKYPEWTLEKVASIDARGISQKHNALILVCAILLFNPNKEVRIKSRFVLKKLIRTGYHALSYLSYINAVRDLEVASGKSAGFGRAKVAVLRDWLEHLSTRELVLQRIKYHNRDGMRLEDIFNFAHPNLSKSGPIHNLIGKWIMGNIGKSEENALQELLEAGNEDAMQINAWAILNNPETSVDEAAWQVALNKIPREAIPTRFLKEHAVWFALLSHIPDHALMRNLRTMSDNGVLKSEVRPAILNRLCNTERLHNSRVTPMDVLKAWGMLKERDTEVADVLENTFFSLMKVQDKVDARVLVAVDVSGSMGIHLSDTQREGLRAIEAATGMALAAKNAFTHVDIMGFSSYVATLNHESLDPDRAWDEWGSSTTASLAVNYMNRSNTVYDAVLFITDNDAWLGNHVQSEVKKYRDRNNVPTVLAVNSTKTSGQTLADPDDLLSLDLSGFVPEVLELLQAKLAFPKEQG